MIDSGAPTPVFLLTGFLGSGKTTLLARLLARPDFADTAVIVNEFGEVGLDHHLISNGEEQDAVVLLDNGCLCCAGGDSLGETLTDLFHRRGRGAIPPFSRVVIETSGLADPGAILATLIADRFMMRRYSVAAVLTAVDAEAGEAQVARYPEAAAQLALADRILLTKTDRVDDARQTALREWLASANPQAEILVTQIGDVDPEALLAPVTTEHPHSGHHGCGHDHHHDHDHAACHSVGITTIFIPIPDPIDWEDYAAIVAHLQGGEEALCLRVKGVICLRGENGPFAVQGVRSLFAPPQPLPATTESRLGLVLIGEGLEYGALAAALQPFGVRI
jgi:G3E family GTPase